MQHEILPKFQLQLLQFFSTIFRQFYKFLQIFARKLVNFSKNGRKFYVDLARNFWRISFPHFLRILQNFCKFCQIFPQISQFCQIFSVIFLKFSKSFNFLFCVFQELQGLKAIIKYVYTLPSNKKNVPELITDPILLIKDVRTLIELHCHDNPDLSVTGRPVLPPQVRFKSHFTNFIWA